MLAVPVTCIYWWMNECHTKTSGTGTTASLTLAFAMKPERKASTLGTRVKYHDL